MSTDALTASADKPTDLDDIRDPEIGLALLAKGNGQPQAPEQNRTRLFWRFQFMQWKAWIAGDRLAICLALYACKVFSKPPPRWLLEASMDFAERGMTPGERREQGKLQEHLLRWEAVKLVRGQRPFDGRNRDNPSSWNDAWAEAAEMLAMKRAAVSADTVKASYALVQAAGGKDITLDSYRRELRRRAQLSNGEN